jgi:hypothetical protein
MAMSGHRPLIARSGLQQRVKVKVGLFDHYLAAFAYRFNHRVDLRDLIATLIVDVARTRPMPERRVRGGHAEAYF